MRRIFWIQHIHCLFSSLCVVVSEFGRNMKFNRKKNQTAEPGLPKLTEVVCMQLNILVWTMIDCNYNPHKNTNTFYSNHLSTFKVEQINNQNTYQSQAAHTMMSSSTQLYLCNIPNYSSSAAWGTISRVVSNHDVTMLSAHVSQWDDRIIMIWPIREDPPCLLQCVSPWLGKVVLKTIRWWGCHITSLITTYNPEQLIFTDCLELTLSLTNLYIVIVLKGKINDLENFKC